MFLTVLFLMIKLRKFIGNIVRAITSK
ncbi:stage V sporulation protein M [Acetobacterium sp. MES1]